MWVFLIMGLTFIAIGLAVHKLKWYFLISGYNTMSKEKQANVDTESLGRLVGIYSYANGGIYFATGILHRLGYGIAIVPAIIFTLVSTLYLIIKSQKYDKNERSSKQTIIGIVIMLISIIFVVGIMYRSVQPTKITFLDEGLEIHGMYGDVYSWDSIESAIFIEELPTIKMRTNGSALGSHLKGNFTTEELGTVKLHVNRQYPPYINIEVNGRNIIFNMTNSSDTRQILDEILSRIE